MEHSPSSVLLRQLLALLLGSVFLALHDGERRFGVVAECDKQLRARLTKSWSELRDDRAQAQVYGRWVRLYVCRRVASDGFRCKLLESLADLVANGRELALRVRLPQQYLGARPLGVGTWIVRLERLRVEESPQLSILAGTWVVSLQRRVVAAALRRQDVRWVPLPAAEPDRFDERLALKHADVAFNDFLPTDARAFKEHASAIADHHPLLLLAGNPPSPLDHLSEQSLLLRFQLRHGRPGIRIRNDRS